MSLPQIIALFISISALFRTIFVVRGFVAPSGMCSPRKSSLARCYVFTMSLVWSSARAVSLSVCPVLQARPHRLSTVFSNKVLEGILLALRIHPSQANCAVFGKSIHSEKVLFCTEKDKEKGMLLLLLNYRWHMVKEANATQLLKHILCHRNCNLMMSCSCFTFCCLYCYALYNKLSESRYLRLEKSSCWKILNKTFL